ncbi:L,D-transpeptidase family protein [Neobacillus sp. YIM B06451]|uniref:L,D-transpeptidase family protein n=1 Tax=Neobacillus sp. YIM B06451 TaxID=3070994 RepID=UPI00292E7BD1|nr:L,D-transpeptidase family protein [Neobacillus sp. YIM B06451]
MKKVLISLLLFFSMVLYEAPALAAGGDFIIINKSTNLLAYYKNSTLVKIFSVGTGREPSLTPEGKFKVVNKIVNRPYYKEKIPGGSPKNPLGKRWLGLNANGTWGTTYAIHGNNNPSSIGKYVSGGCIRMHNEEVQWLFDQVAVNTPVIITASKLPFHSIASANGYKVSGSLIPAAVPSSVTLKKGSKGEHVKTLQIALTQRGYKTNGIDGVFGPGTEAAVKKFQKDNKLKVTGIVDSGTWKALEKF